MKKTKREDKSKREPPTSAELMGGSFSEEAKTRGELLGEIAELRRRLASAVDAEPKDDRRTSDALLRLFIEHAPAALAMFDRRMRYIGASRRWFQDYGLAERDLCGTCHYELFPEIPERWKEAHRRGLAGEVVRAEEDHFERADGSVQWQRWEIRPWNDAPDSIGGIVIFTEDITGLKKVEAALRESEEHLNLLFERSPVPMMVVDPVDLRFFRVNEKAVAFSGYSREEFAHLTILDFDFDLTLDELRAKGESLREKGWHQFETRIRTKNGDFHDIQVTGQVIQIGARPYFLQIFEDITIRKEMERELIRAKEMAEEASRAKGEFLANMSHEIRTPLTVVMGAVELLLQMPANAEQRELLEMANDSGCRLQNLIEDILDFSRIEARRLEIRTERFDLRDCLGKAVGLFRVQVRQKGLQLRLDIDPATPFTLLGDPDRLSQVLINLIGNAVKFTHRGSVTLRLERRRDHLLLVVRDTGIGIAESERDRLFQSFSQLDSSPTRRYGGTGLGLSISKALVELMGGTIWVESKEGEGSAFFFTLPLNPENA